MGMEPLGGVCVVGAGFLGTQIGIVSARHGYRVSMCDISSEALASSKKYAKEYVGQWAAEGQVSGGESRGIMRRMRFTGDLAEATRGAEVVIEAVVERLEVKRDVFGKLDELCPPGTLIATNSSSIRVSKIESATRHPERVLNMHFYSNPWRSRVLEIMRGTHTSDWAVEKAAAFSRSIGVTPLLVQRESTGFIFNRVWRAVKRECLRVVDEGVASHEDVDRAWMSLYGTPAGPFGLMDRVGLDVVRDIEMVYYGESGDQRDAPPRLLLEKIERGELGVKTGRGFYTYPNPSYMEPDWLHGDVEEKAPRP
jgi:3-hydroxybutyryl-CoA dehydrogenase